jgi:hypothetical protein
VAQERRLLWTSPFDGLGPALSAIRRFDELVIGEMTNSKRTFRPHTRGDVARRYDSLRVPCTRWSFRFDEIWVYYGQAAANKDCRKEGNYAEIYVQHR